MEYPEKIRGVKKSPRSDGWVLTLTLSDFPQDYLPTYLHTVSPNPMIVLQQLATDVILMRIPHQTCVCGAEKEIRGYRKATNNYHQHAFLCAKSMTIPHEIRWFDDLFVTHQSGDILLCIYKLESIDSGKIPVTH